MYIRYPLKLDRGQARSRYGAPFVSMMMRDQTTIVMDERQDWVAMRIKAIREGHITPFEYEWVYVVHNGMGRCKVGRSFYPRTRFNALNSSSPVPLQFHGAMIFGGRGGAATCEKAVHRKLSAMGRHSKGEWFDVDCAEALSLVQEAGVKSNGTSNLSGAFAQFEEIMPIFKAMAADDEPRRIKADKCRAEFLWVMSNIQENA